ncbi:MAG: ABC transporter ATP-binding protein [Halolamina sp.]
MSANDPLLAVEGLEKHYSLTSGFLQREVGRVQAVDGISFTVERGETVGLIGESGCGKSTAAASLLRIEEPTGGTVRFDGTDLGSLSADDLREFRRRASMVFQDPAESFDPRMSVGESVAEPLQVQGLSDRATRRRIVSDLLERVRLDPGVADRNPGSLSGGQKQRAGLARALALNPDLLVLDEPVSALDVSVQAEIIELLRDLQADLGLAVLLITHDTGVVRELCDRVNVMYLGEIVERAPVETLFSNPKHPYTRALVDAIPQPDPRAEHHDPSLRGELPDPESPPSGCRFHTRCPSIIQPDDLGMAQETYLGVADLRRALGSGEFPPGEEWAPAAGVDAAVRDAFDLPESFEDPTAVSAFADAVTALEAGDVDAATRALDPLASVCESTPPAFREVDGRPVACHLYDGVD